MPWSGERPRRSHPIAAPLVLPCYKPLLLKELPQLPTNPCRSRHAASTKRGAPRGEINLRGNFVAKQSGLSTGLPRWSSEICYSDPRRIRTLSREPSSPSIGSESSQVAVIASIHCFRET